MLFRKFIFCSIIVTLMSCKTDKGKQNISDTSQKVAQTSSDINEVDKDFNSFLERFSKDTTYQISRTVFPLKVNQYDVTNDTDTILYKQRSEFEMIDFRRKKQSTKHSQCNQEVIVNKGDTKASVEIRGIDNGIVVDYLFEKLNGKWMFVSINDSST